MCFIIQLADTLFKPDTVKPQGFAYTEYAALKQRCPLQALTMYEFLVSYILVSSFLFL